MTGLKLLLTGITWVQGLAEKKTLAAMGMPF